MNECKFKIGDRVDTSRWDATERGPNKLNGGVVERVQRDRCESGWLVIVRGRNGYRELDSNWLKPVERELL